MSRAPGRWRRMTRVAGAGVLVVFAAGLVAGYVLRDGYEAVESTPEAGAAARANGVAPGREPSQAKGARPGLVDWLREVLQGANQERPAGKVPPAGETAVAGTAQTITTREPAATMPPLPGTTATDNEPASDSDEPANEAPTSECQLPVGDLVTAGDVHLSPSGFVARDLGPEFELINLAVGAYGRCQSDGTVVERYISLQTSWLHRPTGYRVGLDQRQSSEAAPAIADPGLFTFSDGGYQFTLGATRGEISDGGDRTQLGDLEVSRNQLAALTAALADVAPNLPLDCFYLPRLGDWDDLAAAGLGDPRHLIPAEWTLDEFEVRAFHKPVADCGQAAAPPSPRFASLRFSSQDGLRSVTFSVNLQAAGTGSFPATISEYEASWGTDRYALRVSLSPQPSDEIAEPVLLAAALDPTFNPDCSLFSRDLAEAELASVSIGLPEAPDGYEETYFYGTVDRVRPECDREFEYEGSASASWSFANDEGVFINIVANSTLGEAQFVANPGTVNDVAVSWTTLDGTSYAITSFSADTGFAGIGAAMLKQIAVSLDAGLDTSTLTVSEPEPADVGIVSGW